MKLTMLVSLSGTRDGVDWPSRGGAVDIPDDEAADLIAAGLAKKWSKDDDSTTTGPHVGPHVDTDNAGDAGSGEPQDGAGDAGDADGADADAPATKRPRKR